MNKKQDAFEQISNVGWLSKQPAEFRCWLLDEANVRIFEPGKMLFQSGTPVHSLLGLVSGSAEVWLDHPQLNPLAFHVAIGGAWFGEHIALGLRTWKMSAQAKTETCVVAVPQRAIKAMIHEDPICLKYFGLLSHLHMRECTKVIVELLQQDSFSKVCARLMTLGATHARGNRTGAVKIPIIHDELAALCGISRRTLGRILVELKQTGAIKVQYSTITILDLNQLGTIAAGSRTSRPKPQTFSLANIAAAE